MASERLDHGNIGITLDLHLHVIPGLQEDAANPVDDALGVAMVDRAKPKGKDRLGGT